MRGKIVLYNSQGRKLSEKVYNRWQEHNKIIKEWKELYEERWKTFYYHMVPDIEIQEESQKMDRTQNNKVA